MDFKFCEFVREMGLKGEDLYEEIEILGGRGGRSWTVDLSRVIDGCGLLLGKVLFGSMTWQRERMKFQIFIYLLMGFQKPRRVFGFWESVRGEEEKYLGRWFFVLSTVVSYLECLHADRWCGYGACCFCGLFYNDSGRTICWAWPMGPWLWIMSNMPSCWTWNLWK